jgi:hypothetical protein
MFGQNNPSHPPHSAIANPQKDYRRILKFALTFHQQEILVDCLIGKAACNFQSNDGRSSNQSEMEIQSEKKRKLKKQKGGKKFPPLRNCR